MKTIKTRHLDEIPDQDGNIEMTYEYDIYYFSEDGQEFPKIDAKSYTHSAYEVVFGGKSNSSCPDMSYTLSHDDFESALFLEAVDYLKKEGKKRIGSFIDGLPGYYLIWSAVEGEKPGIYMNDLDPLDDGN